MPGPSALTHAADPVVIIPVAHSLSNLLSKTVNLEKPMLKVIELAFQVNADVVSQDQLNVPPIIATNKVAVQLSQFQNLKMENVQVLVVKLVLLIVHALKMQHQTVKFLKESSKLENGSKMENITRFWKNTELMDLCTEFIDGSIVIA